MRVVIVDDEELGREVLRSRLGLVPDIEIIGEASDGPGAVERITALRPDLVFLDVRMPGMSGLDVLREVSETYLPQVVFVTAYDEHALYAFELHAVDYLLKPVVPARLLRTIERARRNHAQQELAQAHARLARLLDLEEPAPSPRAAAEPLPASLATRPVRRMVLREDGDFLLIRTTEIDALEAAGNYVRIVHGEKVHLVRGTLAEFEQSLEAEGFARIHRSTLVNADRVQRISPQLHGDFTVTLEGGKTYRMSRSYKDRLLP